MNEFTNYYNAYFNTNIAPVVNILTLDQFALRTDKHKYISCLINFHINIQLYNNIINLAALGYQFINQEQSKYLADNNRFVNYITNIHNNINLNTTNLYGTTTTLNTTNIFNDLCCNIDCTNKITNLIYNCNNIDILHSICNTIYIGYSPLFSIEELKKILIKPHLLFRFIERNAAQLQLAANINNLLIPNKPYRL